MFFLYQQSYQSIYNVMGEVVDIWRKKTKNIGATVRGMSINRFIYNSTSSIPMSYRYSNWGFRLRMKRPYRNCKMIKKVAFVLLVFCFFFIYKLIMNALFFIYTLKMYVVLVDLKLFLDTLNWRAHRIFSLLIHLFTR